MAQRLQAEKAWFIRERWQNNVRPLTYCKPRMGFSILVWFVSQIEGLIVLKCNSSLAALLPHTSHLLTTIFFLAKLHCMSAAHLLLWFDDCDPFMVLLSCGHLCWTLPSPLFSPFPLLWHIWKLSIRFLTAHIFSQFSTHYQCSNKIHYSISP